MSSRIPQIFRILHPTDLSENARRAFLHAASFAHRFAAKITVLYVLDEGPPNTKLVLDAMLGREGWEKARKSRESEVIHEMRHKVEAFCRQAIESDPECPYMVDEIIVEVGHPIERILQNIQQTRADMVVIGSRGQGILKETLLGSTSRGVLRSSTVPVLIVQEKQKNG